MGKEFSNPVIEGIDTAVQAANNAIAAVDAAMGDLAAQIAVLQDTDVANLATDVDGVLSSVNGIMTPNKYIHSFGDAKNSQTVAAWTVLYNVTGKAGLLRKFLAWSSNNMMTVAWKITVDGVLKYSSAGGENLYVYGVTQDDEFAFSGGKAFAYYSPNTLTSFGNSNVQVGTDTKTDATKFCVVLPQPIYFSSSLKLEFLGAAGAAYGNWLYEGAIV